MLRADLLRLRMVRIGAGCQQEGMPGPKKLLQLAIAVTHLNLARHKPALCHVGHGHPQVDHAGLAAGVQHDGILHAMFALHPQRDLTFRDVLEAGDVILVLHQGQQMQGLAQLLPLPLARSLAAPLALPGRQLQGLTEAAHGLVHQQQRLHRPQTSAVVGAKLPVHLGILLLRVCQLLPRVAEHSEGAVLVEVELLAVQGVDVRVPDDAAAKLAGADLADAARVTQVHHQ